MCPRACVQVCVCVSMNVCIVCVLFDLHLLAERVDNELELCRFNKFNALLHNVVVILVLNTLQHVLV